MTARLRLVVFSPSIISDVGNPQATTVRAICQAFIEAGHDVTHLEERGNPHLREMLKLRGHAPLREFNERYPLIRYRQYNLTGGWELVVWFGREIGTADAVVAYPGVADAIVREIAAIESPRIVTFWPGVAGAKRDLLSLWYEPAELPAEPGTSRSETHVVANDSADPSTLVSRDARSRADRLAVEVNRLLIERPSSL